MLGQSGTTGQSGRARRETSGARGEGFSSGNTDKITFQVFAFAFSLLTPNPSPLSPIPGFTSNRHAMKIRLLSDLHLEHSHRHPPLVLPACDADVVILAGDIDNGTRAFDWAETAFPAQAVLYVP